MGNPIFTDFGDEVASERGLDATVLHDFLY